MYDGLHTYGTSMVCGSFYIGHTHNLDLRVAYHNDGWTSSTKAGQPWSLVYSESYASNTSNE